jgi:hypothetical protein
MIEALKTPETLVNSFRSTRHYDPGDSHQPLITLEQFMSSLHQLPEMNI